MIVRFAAKAALNVLLLENSTENGLKSRPKSGRPLFEGGGCRGVFLFSGEDGVRPTAAPYHSAAAAANEQGATRTIGRPARWHPMANPW